MCGSAVAYSSVSPYARTIPRHCSWAAVLSERIDEKLASISGDGQPIPFQGQDQESTVLHEVNVERQGSRDAKPLHDSKAGGVGEREVLVVVPRQEL